MAPSLFTVLREEGLTTLKIRYDFSTGFVGLFAAREWDPDFDFTGYNHTFTIDSLLTDDAAYLNTRQVRELYAKHQLSEYLESVIDLLRQGRHVGIDVYYLAKKDIRYMMHIHSWKLGVNNKSYAMIAGGIRRHDPAEPEIEVIIDGLNLGRGMTFKNIAGGLPFGGCKATVTMGPLDLSDLEALAFLAFANDRTHNMTGPDMNFPTEMSDVIQEHGYSPQFTGGPKAKTGETGRPTAYGVYLTMKEALRCYEGSPQLKGKTVALQGLGAVGWYLGEHLLDEGALLTVADIDAATVKRFIDEHPGHQINTASPDEILELEADILAPCAIGGIFHDGNIPKLKCKYIWGSANNQLRASAQAEEYRLAELIAGRGIVFQSEWWHNTAGVICGAEEYLYDGSYETLLRKIEAIMPAKTAENLARAKELGITPTESAYRACEAIVYG